MMHNNKTNYFTEERILRNFFRKEIFWDVCKIISTNLEQIFEKILLGLQISEPKDLRAAVPQMRLSQNFKSGSVKKKFHFASPAEFQVWLSSKKKWNFAHRQNFKSNSVKKKKSSLPHRPQWAWQRQPSLPPRCWRHMCSCRHHAALRYQSPTPTAAGWCGTPSALLCEAEHTWWYMARNFFELSKEERKKE